MELGQFFREQDFSQSDFTADLTLRPGLVENRRDSFIQVVIERAPESEAVRVLGTVRCAAALVLGNVKCMPLADHLVDVDDEVDIASRCRAARQGSQNEGCGKACDRHFRLPLAISIYLSFVKNASDD